MALKKTKIRRRSTLTSRGKPRRRRTAAPVRHLVGFIGAGNMARSLAGGLIANGWPARRIILSDPDATQRRAVAQRLGVKTYADNNHVAARAQVLVLAVKPQVMRDVASGIGAEVRRRRPLIISIAAGIRTADLQRWLGAEIPLVRAMPNTPALVGAGASGLYATAAANPALRAAAESILRAVGVAVWLEDEAQMDIVTALSGSGPAYFFLVMEALERAAVGLGLAAQTSRLLTLETAYGAAKMALEGSEEPAVLRARVTSPGGTTARALQALEQGGLVPLFQRAVRGAAERARELTDMLGKGA